MTDPSVNPTKQIETELAADLAAHAKWQVIADEYTRNGIRRLAKRCICGTEVAWDLADAAHRAHVAAVLAAKVAEAQAVAWDEGLAAEKDWQVDERLASNRRLPSPPRPTNPYTPTPTTEDA